MTMMQRQSPAELVRPDRVGTARGEFATLSCLPLTMALPHGDVLLVPGFTGSKEDFVGVLPLLADAGWSVATYDQRGQYETAGSPDDDYSLEGFAADAAAVADAVFGPGEQVHLVGHSFGGLVAGAAVLREPERWASLTLLCSGPGALPAGPSHQDAASTAEVVRRDGLEAAYRARQHSDDAEQEAFEHRRFLCNEPESLAAIATMLTTAPDRTPELATLDLAVTVIRGEHDDAWPDEVVRAMARALGTHVEVIDGAAHSPAVEQPERTRDALARAFLR